MVIKSRGLTLIELMVTLTIVAIVLSLGLITMRGYLPKQRLSASASLLEGLLQRAQSEASARSYWTCIKFDGNTAPITASLWTDKSGNHGSAGGDCGDGADEQISSVQFKRDIVLATCGGTNQMVPGCEVWFDTTGAPKLCANSGCSQFSGIMPGTGCISVDFSFVLSNPKLDAGARGKEIEALSGGLVNNVKAGDKGLETSVWAKYASFSGIGECE